MPKSSHSARFNYSLQLVTGTDADGKECYSYVLVAPDVAEKLKQKKLKGKLEESGLVIFSGIGTPTDIEHARAMEIFQTQCLKA